MNQTDTAKIMKLIQSQYRGYCKDAEEARFSLAVMNKLFADWEYAQIEKALFRFMQNDSKGFPPVPGQLVTLATEIRKEEYEAKKREQDLLSEPKGERCPMPDEIRQKLDGLFKMPFES